MTVQTYDHIEQGTPAWHDLRRGILTASVVGKLIGYEERDATEFDCSTCGVLAGAPCVSVAKGKTGPLSKCHPPRYEAAREAEPRLTVNTGATFEDFALLLASERITGHTEDTFITDAMWRGIEDEPRAIAVYSEHYAPVTTVGFMVENRFGFDLGYSPDGLVDPDGLVEVKSRAPKAQVKTIVTGEVPAANYAQLQCGLLVSGRRWIDYLSYAGGMHLWPKRITPDPAWFDVIVAAGRALEQRIGEIVTAHHANTEGLVLTERVDDSEIRI